MATIDEPAGIAGAATRVSERSARAFAFSVQSQCLSSVSSAGRITPVAALWTRTSSGPSSATCSSDALRRDVAADEDRLGPERSQLVRRLLGGGVRAHVADRDARGAVAGEAERDRLADPARAARDQDGPAHQRAPQPARGSGRVDRRRRRDLVPADPGRAAPRARRPRPSTRRSRDRRAAAIFSSPKLPHRVVLRQVGDQLAHAGPELEREVGGGGPDEGLDVVEGRLCHRGASVSTGAGGSRSTLRR